jgi:UDP:flavonoid glycosyltransferase YjiC (YdhE family)
MSQRSLYIAGLVPLLFAILYFQLGNLQAIYYDVANAFNLPIQSVPARENTPIIMAATPGFSHVEKVTTITQGLISLGYPVSFITGTEFKDYIESIGATYIPTEGQGGALMSDEDMGTFVGLQGNELEVFAFKTIFIKTIPAQYRTLQRTFSDLKNRYGKDQKLIYIFDASVLGLAPVMLGAPGIRPHASIGLGIAPYVASSNDTFPFRSGRQPDTSPDSQRIHFEAQQAQYRDHPIDTPVNKELNTVLKELGAKQNTPSLYDAIALSSDIYLQYGVPAFEYKRSDWRPHLSFMGAPVAVGIADRKLPEWWDDVLAAKKAGKKIVAVSSSSIVFDTHALIKPALEALGERDDVFVIATLVTSDVENLDFKIPQNARVAKFIPLDLVLPFVRIPNSGVLP